MTDSEFHFMEYPGFIVILNKGIIIPNGNLPRNWKDLVPKFYHQERKVNVVSYVSELTQMLSSRGGLNLREKVISAEWDIRLNWDDTRGLTNIGINGAAGLDLNERESRFGDHNLGVETGIIAGIVLQEYVLELLKSA